MLKIKIEQLYRNYLLVEIIVYIEGKKGKYRNVRRYYILVLERIG